MISLGDHLAATPTALATLNPLDPHSLLTNLGALGVFLVLFAETGLLIGFFLPGDSLLFTAGLLSATAASSTVHLSLTTVLPAALAGALLGAQTGHLMGARVGSPLLERGSHVRLQQAVTRARLAIDRYGPGKAIVLARFIPLVRTVINPLAGIVGIPARTFLLWQVLGGAVWTLGITLGGYALGSSVPNVDRYLLPMVAVIVVLSLLPVAAETWRSRPERAQHANLPSAKPARAVSFVLAPVRGLTERGTVTLRGAWGASWSSERQLGARVALGTGVLAVASVPFALLVLIVESRWRPMLELDDGARDSLHRYALTHRGFATLMQTVSNSGSALAWQIVTVVLVAVLLWRRQVRSALFVIVANAGSSLLNGVVKSATNRARPVVDHPLLHEPGKSFPSGHAQAAAVGYTVLLLVALPYIHGIWRRVSVAVAAIMVAAIGFSRVALAAHYVSDVLAAYLLGLAWVAVMAATFHVWRRASAQAPRYPQTTAHRDAAHHVPDPTDPEGPTP